ncbi:MAG: bifunctional UDP-N-acetylglucosamine diphosphorylase/glucosamine-1-phosphate N-acetyltransferase GlmU [Rhizobiaceae bacterium]
MSARSCLAIILAAGEGTRMKSALPKVLHPVGGLPMVAHVVRAAVAAGVRDVALVVGREADKVAKAAMPFAAGVSVHLQEQRLGTANAVLAARDAIAKGYDDLIIMFGDTPLIDTDALSKARSKLAGGADVVVMGFRPADPAGYGRLVEENGQLVAIVEEKEASETQKKIGYCNGGLMAIAGKDALAMLDEIDNKNAKGEYYLTDIVVIARKHGKSVVSLEVAPENVLGVNTRVELAEAEALFQHKMRKEMMLGGVSMIAPETVFFSWDTEIGAETTIEPNVYFGPKVKIAGGVDIHAFCHIEGATVATGASVGPFARLRPDADLRENAKVGNFVEVKKSVIGRGSKVSHLTYIGDTFIGEEANIGAGTITCNYDGYNKHVTNIGDGAFIGSNTALVAPVSVGANAITGAGSVITKDVPADALAVTRAKQEVYEGMAKKLHARNKAIKEAKNRV